MGQTCDLVFRLDRNTAIANNTTDFFTSKAFGSGAAKLISFSVVLDTATTLSLRINDATNVTLNAGVALIASALYTFSFIADPSNTYTFRAGAACNVMHFVGIASLE